MRKLLLLVWVLLPLPVVAYHFGPGQDRQRLDSVAQALAEARAFGDQDKWASAAAKYEAALKELPDDRRSESFRIRLERAKAQMQAKALPQAHKELIGLVDDLKAEASADPGLLAEARAALANSQYYMTWLMRLEGVSRDEWEPEIEAARQTWKLLAEEAAAAGDSATARLRQEDLESAIRLARLDLKELQGLPLPNQ